MADPTPDACPTHATKADALTPVGPVPFNFRAHGDMVVRIPGARVRELLVKEALRMFTPAAGTLIANTDAGVSFDVDPADDDAVDVGFAVVVQEFSRRSAEEG